MLLLIASSLIITTLSQTWITWNKEEAMVIKNVIYQNANQIRDLVIPSNQQGEEFKFVIDSKDISIGKYKTHKEEVLEFSKKSTYSAYRFEEEIQKKKVKYNDVIIQPTWSYMISAHGAEFRNIHNRQQDTTQAWTHVSDLWFFIPSYTESTISDGEKWTKWFESGKFGKLKKEAETKGEIVSTKVRNYQGIKKQGSRVNQHYAAYGDEFEISSGVYRMIRNTGKWEVEQMATIPNRKVNNIGMLVELFDIVHYLETHPDYGAGQFYWNGCRQDLTGTRRPTDYAGYPILPFQQIVNVKTPSELKAWRTKQKNKCIHQWHFNKKKYIAQNSKKRYADAMELLHSLQQEQNKQKWKKMVEDMNKELKKVTGAIKMPEFTAYNCERNIRALKVKQEKIRNIYNKYVIKYRKIQKSEESEESVGSTPWGSNQNNHLTFVEVPAREEYYNSYYDGDVSEEQNSTISIVMMSMLFICLCFICFGGMISGSIFGYLAHGYIKNNGHKYQNN
eukprot:339167_1